MSLVDYASSSDEEETEAREEKRESSQAPNNEPEVPKDDPPPLQPPPQAQRPGPSSNQQLGSYSHPSEPPAVMLPDPSLLLNSPAISSHLVSGWDHSSRVAAAMAESASRKRDTNGLASALPRSKVPRGNLPHSRSIPETGGGLLVPPQLSGRSNVVTEDISKLFVRKNADPTSQ
ncbi:uncharacterized protein LOC132295095 [Cornus florida]|uniref:uncharacterized protein LOC132295095 n=1 Tax=Cornus florida TaxID=4283 RepID=UPI00289EC7B8|nr:uncharacterized protein LOC132295095 [Cornus florida]